MKKILNFCKAFILPVVFYAIFTLLSKGRMANMGAFLSILQQSVYPAIIAFAIYNGVELGLWDLTPGAILIGAAVIGGNVAQMQGWGILGLVFCIAVLCIAMSLANCTVQVLTGIPSMIVSCGMVMVYESLTAVAFSGSFSAPREWTFFSRSPYCYIILTVCFFVMYFVANRTKFGYQVRALGYGKQIAMNIGISPKKTIYKAYLLEGVLLTFASLIYLSMNGSASAAMNLSTTSIGFNAIVSVLVGQYLAVYCGPLFGICIGAVTLRILSSGLLALGLAATWQRVANGIFLILFLGFSQNQKIIEAARLRKKKVQEIMARIQK